MDTLELNHIKFPIIEQTSERVLHHGRSVIEHRQRRVSYCSVNNLWKCVASNMWNRNNLGIELLKLRNRLLAVSKRQQRNRGSLGEHVRKVIVAKFGPGIQRPAKSRSNLQNSHVLIRTSQPTCRHSRLTILFLSPRTRAIKTILK